MVNRTEERWRAEPGAPWGLAGGRLLPVRGAYLLHCAAQDYCLKPTWLSRREALFVGAALDHLAERGFPGAPRLVRSPEGEPLARVGRRRFQLLTWQAGEEADYLRPGDAEQAAVARRGGLCHHDLAHHNVLLTAAGPALVDFDCVLADLGLHDLANLLRRLLRLAEWDPAPGRAVLAAYRELRPFGEGEAAALLPLLRFPEEAWQTGHQYYAENLPWPEERYLELLARKGDTAPARDRCLAALAETFRPARRVGPRG